MFIFNKKNYFIYANNNLYMMKYVKNRIRIKNSHSVFNFASYSKIFIFCSEQLLQVKKNKNKNTKNERYYSRKSDTRKLTKGTGAQLDMSIGLFQYFQYWARTIAGVD